MQKLLNMQDSNIMHIERNVKDMRAAITPEFITSLTRNHRTNSSVMEWVHRVTMYMKMQNIAIRTSLVYRVCTE